MERDKINQAFEGRWRIKGKYIEDGIILFNSKEGVAEAIKKLCRDFCEAGIMLANHDGLSVVEDSVGNFKEWWELYDKKRGKEKCYLKWRKMTLKEQQACIDATPAYVASTPDKQFRKDPLTYLNQKSWNDEIINRNHKDELRQQRLDDAAAIIAKYAG